MKGGFKISLRANERIYVNGAVIKVDRKTSLEFLNNVQFLLENHVLQAEDATTPLRQSRARVSAASTWMSARIIAAPRSRSRVTSAGRTVAPTKTVRSGDQ